MKDLTFHNSRTTLTPTKAMKQLLCIAFLLFSAQLSTVIAQASLSVQGILKKSNGVAVEDGVYNITFRLYTAPAGGSAIWTETQTGVEVTSGIYSTILGTTTSLNVPFNQLYYLGVTIGSSELTPRIQLTSAPYALSLIGSTNQFPSSGLVRADSVKVNGGVLARGGAPGVNGASRNGYAFSGNTGDKDSGLFSTADGKVSMYANNTEVVAVTSGNVNVNGDVAVQGSTMTNEVILPNGGNVNYNGKDDWRLVVDDNLTGGANGWQVYNAAPGQNVGWNNPSSAGASPIGGNASNFAGLYLYPTNNNQVLKKFYDFASVGSFNYIKVKFKYFYFDTWGWGENDRAWAAVADGVNGSQMRVGWSDIPAQLGATSDLSTNEFVAANNFDGNTPNGTDYSQNGEMTFFKSGNSFWLYFGAGLDEDTNNESYAVGMIEIWVK